MTKLHTIRKRMHITQAQLARMIGCTRASVNQAEKGGIKTLKTAKKYALPLCCKPEHLIDELDTTRRKHNEL